MLKDLYHIIRLPNLLMIGLIQSLIYHRLLDENASLMHWGNFFHLSFITMLIAAGGYVINDYYDARIDQINRPNEWIAGNTWPLRRVLNLYFILVAIGGIFALWFAVLFKLWPYIFLYPVGVLGLWVYSFVLKCKPLTGNIWVALFCGGVVVIVGMPDFFLHNQVVIKPELWYYAAFAFLSTWYREVVKDLEDVEGDKAADCRTFIVRFGMLKGKILAGATALFLLVALLFWEVSYTDQTLRLLFTVMEGSIVASFAFVWWAKEAAYFHRASLMIKGIMLAGTLMLLFI